MLLQSGLAFDAAISSFPRELEIPSGLSLEKIIPKKGKDWRGSNTENEDNVTKRDADQELQPDKVLSEKICSMMVPSKNKTPNGKMAHTCKVCGKEAQKSNIKHHIERHHMQGWKKDLKRCMGGHWDMEEGGNDK